MRNERDTKILRIEGYEPALANGDNVSFLDSEGRGAVSGNVLVSLLETVVFGYIVEVVTAHNDGPLHLGGHNNSSQDTTSNAHITSEGALLINVLSLDGGLGGLVSQTNVLVKSHSLLGSSTQNTGLADIYGGLLLESSLGLMNVHIISKCSLLMPAHPTTHTHTQSSLNQIA